MNQRKEQFPGSVDDDASAPRAETAAAFQHKCHKCGDGKSRVMT